jgi:4-hydroxybenzoate polyprenyltransferase
LYKFNKRIYLAKGLLMNFLPSRSTLLHLRFPFSLFLMPVYIFALSQVPIIHMYNAVAAFIAWHLFVYPASNGYNSYFDKDEDSIALLKHPPKVDKSLYNTSLLIEAAGVILAFTVSFTFALAVVIYGILSKLYSHPSVRLKKYPFISFFVVFLFQGAFVYWASYAAITGSDINSMWDQNFALAGLICSCLIGASYPLTQVYQHEEDSKRGDKTLSIVLGLKGSFVFSGILFFIGGILLLIYWSNMDAILNFYVFLVFCIPVLLVFAIWLIRVFKDANQANFQNMSIMVFTSSISILLYFLFVFLKDQAT